MVSVDNFGMLESYSTVYCGDQQRSFQDTTVQLVPLNVEPYTVHVYLAPYKMLLDYQEHQKETFSGIKCSVHQHLLLKSKLQYLQNIFVTGFTKTDQISSRIEIQIKA